MSEHVPIGDITLQEIEARHAAAGKGLWQTSEEEPDEVHSFSPTGKREAYLGYFVSVRNAEFAAHAHQDVPRLIAEIRYLKRLFSELDAARLDEVGEGIVRGAKELEKSSADRAYTERERGLWVKGMAGRVRRVMGQAPEA
jgi:hypothetical protein